MRQPKKSWLVSSPNRKGNKMSRPLMREETYQKSKDAGKYEHVSVICPQSATKDAYQ